MEKPQSERCFRPRQFYLSVGMTGILLIVGLGFILAALMSQGDAVDFPLPAVLFSCFIGAGFIWLGVWMILCYFRERLVITDSTMTRYESSRITVVPVDQISQVVWFTGFGAIRIESPVGGFKFNLDSFTQPEQREIITFLRNTVNLEKQQKWDYFYEGYRRVIDPQAGVMKNELVSSVIFLALSGLLIYFWWIGSGPFYLVTALMSLFGAVRIYQGH